MGKYIAVDLGAESGREILGEIKSDHIAISEIHRFLKPPIEVNSHLFWDVLHIFSEIIEGLRKIEDFEKETINSIAIDSWAFDFGLLDKDNFLIGNPVCYRDDRTRGITEEIYKRIGRFDIYKKSSGIYSADTNTSSHLLAMRKNNPELLDSAKYFLMVPDLINFWLCSEMSNEYTLASTTQLYNGENRIWSKEIIKKLGIPENIFLDVNLPGTRLGKLRQTLIDETKLVNADVVLSASHDTASAVLAVPALEDEFIWLSSGTWSLLGINTEKPVISENALDYTIGNFGSGDGKFIPLKPIMGLWLIQGCRKAWEKDGESASYDAITNMARSTQPFLSMFDTDDASFLNPKDMPEAINEYFKKTGQRIPSSKGEYTRVILESLALKYRWTYEKFREISGRDYDRIYLVGGGAKNALLNQFTANALKIPVIAGPFEATAMGNIVSQAISSGEFRNVKEARRLIRNSSNVTVIDPEPKEFQIWDDMFARYTNIIK